MLVGDQVTMICWLPGVVFIFRGADRTASIEKTPSLISLMLGLSASLNITKHDSDASFGIVQL